MCSSLQNYFFFQGGARALWLHGLARRYGRGDRPTLAHMQDTPEYLHLPWSLKKASLQAEADHGQIFEEQKEAVSRLLEGEC